MPQPYAPLTPLQKLNKLTPGAADTGLGDIINELITAVNAGRADHNTLIAKLNLDAGVTDTNYAASTASALTVLSAR